MRNRQGINFYCFKNKYRLYLLAIWLIINSMGIIFMEKALALLKAVSDKNRLRILSVLLVHEELCACQITEFLQVAGATASRLLSQMVNSGVLQNRKQGRWVYFRLNREDALLPPLFKWIDRNLEHSTQVTQDLEALEKIQCVSCEDLSLKQRNGGS
ncbi:MAG: winged helix-turn-helix transcriptional regulator [Desulfobacter sp.]|nr:MAG: winged helix-turn-helix transcriptional regulator [Desulfobacter sp.]